MGYSFMYFICLMGKMLFFLKKSTHSLLGHLPSNKNGKGIILKLSRVFPWHTAGGVRWSDVRVAETIQQYIQFL